jgi:hypothetical protein
MPTAAHVIYIPSMLMLGIVLGYILGTRAARDAYAAQEKRKAARAAREAERQQRKATAPAGEEQEPPPAA